MSGKAFFDTNILTYSFQTPDRERSTRALTLISQEIEAKSAVISFQVVQEFLNLAFRKSVPVMTASEAAFYLSNVLSRFEIVHSSVPLYEQALAMKGRYGFHWYDSLMIAAALEADCETLYTEDLQHGQMIGNLRIVNPFL